MKKEKREKTLGLKSSQDSRSKWTLPLAITVSAAIFTGLFAYRFLYWQPQKPQLKAAIVDQLGGEYPNSGFNQTATSLLRAAGFYQVDYYGYEAVTVEFYRDLATHGYGLIILRAHSALRETKPLVDLFTSERYDEKTRSKYDAEFDSGQLTVAKFFGTGELYVAVGPDFVRLSMLGSFANTIIVMMGCNGMSNTSMADALVEKGASLYFGWTSAIEVGDTDAGTTQLLTHFLASNMTVNEAVAKTNLNYAVMGVSLDYYPRSMDDFKLSDIVEA